MYNDRIILVDYDEIKKELTSEKEYFWLMNKKRKNLVSCIYKTEYEESRDMDSIPNSALIPYDFHPRFIRKTAHKVRTDITKYQKALYQQMFDKLKQNNRAKIYLVYRNPAKIFAFEVKRNLLKYINENQV